MSKIIQQGPSEPDPINELRDEVDTLRSEFSGLKETIRADHEWFKRALREILQELQMKSDRND